MPGPALTEIPAQTETLFHVSEIIAYNDWIFSWMKPFLGSRLLEVGCGIGTYTKRIAAVAGRVVALDPVHWYAATARATLAEAPAAVVIGALPGDVAFRPGSFDSAVCLNVIEHLEEPEAALVTLASWLVPTGTLFVQVPAHPFLFGSVDRALGHCRRYTAASLITLLESCGLEVVLRPRYLYALATPGWWFVGRVLRQAAVPAGSVRLANAIARLSRALDDRVRLPFGLTLVAAARVPA